VKPRPAEDGDRPKRPRMHASEVEVFDGVAGVTIGDTLLTLWRTPARPERIRRVTAWTEALIRDTPGRIAACQFILSTASPPNRAARAETLKGFRLVEPHARRLITVPVGGAIWHRLVRTIIRTGVVLWGRSKLIKVAGSENEAFSLLMDVATDRSPDRRELRAALASLHAALEPGEQ